MTPGISAPVTIDPVTAGRLTRRRRTRNVTAVLTALAVVAFLLALFTGPEWIAPDRVVAGLFGNGEARNAMQQLRLPRAVNGLLAGAAFGLSGALLQLIARNPLASPDLIGISAGASAAAVFSILVLGWGGLLTSFAAVVGALAAAALIYLLARKNGVAGYRLVLVGIGVAAVANALISYLLTRGEVRDVQEAFTWLVGSLHGRFWAQATPLMVAFALLMPLTAVLHRPLRALTMGDDLATGFGVRAERSRGGLLLVAVLAAAIATAAAGPVAFVALVSAPVARRLLPGGALALVPSMLVGAVGVVISDIIAQHIVPGTTLPVGVITGAIGAPYLLWLLIRSNKEGRG